MRRILIIFSIICTLLFWNCTRLYANTTNGSASAAEPVYMAASAQNQEEQNAEIESIEFGDFEKKLEVGKSLALNAKVIPEGEQDQTIKYYSSDNSVATVSLSGKVTGHKPGEVTITATCGNARADAELIIYYKTEKIELNETYITMQPNETFQIKSKVFPEAAEQNCTYESTNENVITVNEKGKITAKKSGIASVLVSNGDALETITVIVNNAADAKSGDAVQTSDNSDVEEEHIENSQLAAMIHSSSSKEIVISGKDLSILDASSLSILKKENKNLVFDKGTYSILVNGREIINPAISLMLDIPIEYIEDSIKFVVNEGQPLHGKITIQIKDKSILTKKYLYLYNQVKNKYEKINCFNVDDKSISIDKGGTYLLTEKSLAKFKINWIAVISVTSGCIILLGIYLFTKKRYWFY